MTPTFDKIHLKFKLNGNSYNVEDLNEVAYSLVKEGAPYEKVMGDFLMDWLDAKDYINVRTSGSTGKPKLMKVSKQAMVNSAIATGNYFNMEPGQKALLCLPTHYIAGKMMLVRAMVLGLELDFVDPTSQPVFDYGQTYDFCAMIPLQLKNTVDYIYNIKTLIIGGATISQPLEDAIQGLETKIFATYGMTETVSHVAVKAMNGEHRMKYFTVFPDVSISQDGRGCLVIDAPKVALEQLVTTDVVNIHSPTEFELIGRADNIINSGGVKLFPEQIEAKLAGKIKERFIIASQLDVDLGEKLILVVESDKNTVDNSAFADLDKFEVPKDIYNIPKFKETATGKIQRKDTLKLLGKNIH
ncbi:AMP-binding protein [Gelidibacter salicanalis]|uniref:AMP-binding protein n=1 Tax=Gelidibacter salicanalis TaxID=291193 RepID=A0A934KR57_9FLAO|nr:AMP-binding protein [Gelidibacter salicanalis]MBJ7879926.1 AMP-binding protein [Gelidibacter salicanalis]